MKIDNKNNDKFHFSDLEPIFPMKGCNEKDAIFDFLLQTI